MSDKNPRNGEVAKRLGNGLQNSTPGDTEAASKHRENKRERSLPEGFETASKTCTDVDSDRLENKGGTIKDEWREPVEAALVRALDRAATDEAILAIVEELKARRGGL